MDSESEHELRDDENVSEPEEIEEPKPKSALKKPREAAPPVERPQLPYVS
jgi:translation initiation factor 2 subunit 3